MPSNFLPFAGNTSVGQRTAHGTWLPPGSRVAAYVGPQSESTDAYSSSSLLVATLDAGLARCRAGKGDVVAVLPGHTENFATADACPSLVAGTQIIGCAPFGSGLMPTFTFTGTAATFLLDQNNVTLSGLKFACGIDAVVSYVTATGTGCYLSNNIFNLGTASTNDAGTGLIIGNGASDLTLEGNRFIGTSTAVHTACITASGTGLDNLRLIGNEFFASCATTGLVNVTGTGINILVTRNTFFNRTGTTPQGIRFTDTALEALVNWNEFAFLTGITTTTGAITVVAATTSEIRTSNNYGVDADTVNSVVCGTGTAT